MARASWFRSLSDRLLWCLVSSLCSTFSRACGGETVSLTTCEEEGGGNGIHVYLVSWERNENSLLKPAQGGIIELMRPVSGRHYQDLLPRHCRHLGAKSNEQTSKFHLGVVSNEKCSLECRVN